MTPGTIAVALILACIVALIIIGMVRKKRKGKCVSCDNCSACPYGGCPAQPEEKESGSEE